MVISSRNEGGGQTVEGISNETLTRVTGPLYN